MTSLAIRPGMRADGVGLLQRIRRIVLHNTKLIVLCIEIYRRLHAWQKMIRQYAREMRKKHLYA